MRYSFAYILVIGISFILFRKWKEIYSFFVPTKFWKIVMNYKDGSVGMWLYFRKNMSKNYFTYEKEDYYPNFRTNYYNKKVRLFYFNEGTREGIELDRNVIIRNTKIENELFDLKISRLFDLRNNNQKIWEDYGFIIVIAVVVILGFLYLKKNGFI